jgi:hypothetical protein
MSSQNDTRFAIVLAGILLCASSVNWAGSYLAPDKVGTLATIVAAIGSIATALASLYIASNAQSEARRAQSPIISCILRLPTEESERVGYSLRNSGLGPAIKIRYQWFIDGIEVPQSMLQGEVTRLLQEESDKVGISRKVSCSPGQQLVDHLAPSDCQDVFWLDDETQRWVHAVEVARAMHVRRRVIRRIIVRISYSSVFGESFTT